jgi:hypothetical protein
MRHFALLTLTVVVALFLGMLLCLEIGRRLGVRQLEKLGPSARTGVGVADSVVYAVLALLLGFVFSGAMTRYDQRRTLVVEEVSTISTAWSRIDALPYDRQPAIRAAFQEYVDSLISTYVNPKLPDTPEGNRVQSALLTLQDHVWKLSVAACLTPEGEKARMLLLPSLNEMFDVIDRERLARRIHPPQIIWVMVGVAALAAALFAGYSMAGPKRNWIYVIGIAATISVITWVIVEVEYPRLGLIRVNAFDRALMEQRATMR